jgi:hypothetical protein
MRAMPPRQRLKSRRYCLMPLMTARRRYCSGHGGHRLIVPDAADRRAEQAVLPAWITD